eukprot:8439675-Pyramimonas_sp.AAC.1
MRKPRPHGHGGAERWRDVRPRVCGPRPGQPRRGHPASWDLSTPIGAPAGAAMSESESRAPSWATKAHTHTHTDHRSR